MEISWYKENRWVKIEIKGVLFTLDCLDLYIFTNWGNSAEECSEMCTFIIVIWNKGNENMLNSSSSPVRC